MSDDPARNDILRLDEMMSRKPDWIDSYRLAIYFISIRYRYLITDYRCDSDETSRDTKLVCCVASYFIVSGVQGSSLQVSAK